MSTFLKKSLVVGMAVCAAGALLLPSGAYAQGAAQPVVGVVDVQKVFGEYKVTKSSNDEINKLAAGFKSELDIRQAHRLLTEAEVAELVKLKAKTPQAEADTKRIDELEKLSKQRDEELNALSNKATPDETERARLRELRELANKNQASAQTLAEDYGQQVDKRQKDLSDKITEDIKQAIAKAAQQKGIATVIDKPAVLYGGTDMTDEVIKLMNGK